MKFSYFSFIPFILSTFVSINFIFSQDNVSSQWVTISNDYITISMDKSTGRYLVFDNEANYAPLNVDSALTNIQYLKSSSPLPETLTSKSVILGKIPDALNFAILKINGSDIAFGSSSGKWLGSPIINSDSIVYGWRIGKLDIIQTIRISTNIDTLFQDAVTVSYDVINTDENLFNTVGVKIFLDPSVNEFLEVPFFLLDNQSIFNEYEYFKNNMPEFWLASDPSGNISSLSIKSFLKGPGIITPDKIYITTLDKALKNIWNFNFNKRNRLSQKDTAVLMFYDPKTIPPNDSITLASFQISKPALINTFQNNGLEARASTFSTKNTTPMIIDVWVKNVTNTIFDSVDLTIETPNWMTILDAPTKTLSYVGYLDIATPVSWNITSKEDIGRSADIRIKVEGKQNGIVTSSFDIPITVNLVAPFKQNNTTELKTAVANAVTNIITQPSINFEQFQPNDTSGITSETLEKVYQQLKSINSTESREIIKLIDTEQQLLKEIKETEKSINEINMQYAILLGIYQNLYVNSNTVDVGHIKIQEISDNLEQLENQLQQQEKSYSKISQIIK